VSSSDDSRGASNVLYAPKLVFSSCISRLVAQLNHTLVSPHFATMPGDYAGLYKAPLSAWQRSRFDVPFKPGKSTVGGEFALRRVQNALRITQIRAEKESAISPDSITGRPARQVDRLLRAKPIKYTFRPSHFCCLIRFLIPSLAIRL